MDERIVVKTERLKGRRFALPARLIRPHVGALCEVGIMPEWRKLRVEPYQVDAALFTGKDRDHAENMLGNTFAILGPGPLIKREESRLGRWKIPFFCGVTGEISIVPVCENGEEEQKETADDDLGGPIYREIRGRLEYLSRLAGGLNISFHQERKEAAHPPPPDRDGHLNIYPWTYPPGISENFYPRKLFGRYVSKEAAGILTFKGAPGRGEFASDGKHDVVQMVGNNWYLLHCVVEYFNVLTTMEVFDHTLAAALRRWQDLKAGARPANKLLPMSRRTFNVVAGAWVNAVPENVEKALQKMDQELERMRRELAFKERERSDLGLMYETLKDGRKIQELIGTLGEQHGRIISHPSVVSLEMVGDGLQVTTVPLTIEHAGKRYSVGRFAIYINKVGMLSVWNLDRLHPNGVPHPHISRSGSPCMGNASMAIKDAMTQHRYADAIEYLVRWLADGYEDELATHKITEWPLDDKGRKEDIDEPIAEKTHARHELQPAG